MTRNNQLPKVKPGETVPDSGIYVDIIAGQTATLVKGEPAPPTDTEGSKWQQIIDTNPQN